MCTCRRKFCQLDVSRISPLSVLRNLEIGALNIELYANGILVFASVLTLCVDSIHDEVQIRGKAQRV